MSRIYQGGQSEKRYRGGARDASFNPNQVTGAQKAIREEGAQKLENLKTQDRGRRRNEQSESQARQAQQQLDRTQLKITQQQFTDQQNLEQAIDRNLLQAAQTYEKGELVLDQLVERTDQGIQFTADKSKLGFGQLLEKQYLEAKDLEEKTTLGIESRAVQANNALNIAELNAQQSVAAANRSVTQNAISGLLQFGSDAANAWAGIEQTRIDKETKEQEQLAEFDWLFSDSGSVSGAANVVKENTSIQTVEVAEEQGIQAVASGPVQAEAMRQPMADVTMGRNLEQRDINVAALSFGADLQTIMADPNTRVTIRGKSVAISDISTVADYNDALQQVARQITREYGLTGKNQFAAQMTYGRAVKGALAAQLSQNASQIQARAQGNRAEAALSNGASLISNGLGQEGWNAARSGYISSGEAFGKTNKEINDTVLKDLMSRTADEDLPSLMNVLKDPQNSGSSFGNDRFYRDMIQDEITARRTQKYDRNNLDSKVNTLEAKKIVQSAANAVYMSNSPEETLAIRQDAIARLEANGSPEAIDAAAKLRAKGNLTPAVYDGLNAAFDAGEPPTTEEIADALISGAISTEQADQLKARGETSDQIKKQLTEAGLADSKGLIKGVVTQAIVRNGEGKLTSAEAGVEADPIAANIQKRFDSEMRRFILGKQGKATATEIQQESQRLLGEIRKDLYGTNPDKLNTGSLKVAPDGSVSYSGYGEPPPVRITINQETGRPVDNHAYTPLKDIPKGKAYAGDVLFTRSDFLKEVQVLQAGGQDFSTRTKTLAKELNMTPQQLLERQAGALGYDKTQLGRINFGSLIGTEPINSESGKKALMALGFTDRGSAYLAGNIQQESTWDGSRPPWDDVGAPAGGLVSWRAGRLDKIEKHLGKSIESASPSEQLVAMKWEMKKDYPAAYRVFTNPSATDTQLRRASMQYWGYGEEGKRFEYAQSLITGSPQRRLPVSPYDGLSSYRSQIYGPGSITFERDDGQPGMDIFFENHQFPAVLSGRVKDIDYESRYGHYLVIESVDPTTGDLVDVLYGHLAEAAQFNRGDQITTGQIIGRQGGTGNVQSVDGTIASIDFLAPAPTGSKSMAPYYDYKRLRQDIARALGQ